MIVYFADRGMAILGMASTDLPRGFTIQNDNKINDVETGVASLEFTISHTAETREQAQQMCAAGNYLIRYHKNTFEFYTIIEKEHDNLKQTFTVYGEDAGLDLLNEVCPAEEITTAQGIEYYIERYTRDSGWEIGLNEIPSLTRALSWDSEQNASERIRSVATQFDNAELGYSFDIEGLSVKHKYINIYKKRGADTGATLRLGQHFRNIKENESVANLLTELIPTGGTPDGQDQPITLAGYDYPLDSEGYYVTAGGRLRSTKANEIWSRYRSESGTGAGYLTGLYSYDTTNKTTLLRHALTELKKIDKPETNYELDIIDLPEGVSIGDTCRITDEEDEVFLEARLLKIEESVANGTTTGTFGDFLIKEAGIAAEIRELAAQFQDTIRTRQFYTWFAYADDAQGTGISLDPTGKTFLGIATLRQNPEVDISDPSVFTWSEMSGGGGGGDAVTLTVTSSAGAVFKNSLINTTLTAHVYKNGVELSAPAIAGLGTVRWYSISGGTETLLGTGITYTVSSATALNAIAKLED